MDGSFDKEMESGTAIPDIDADLLDALEFNEAMSKLKREIYSWARCNATGLIYLGVSKPHNLIANLWKESILQVKSLIERIERLRK
jgi:hypothetical protein